MIDENFWFPNFSIIANAYRKVNRISRKSVKFYINFTIEKQYRRFEMKRRYLQFEHRPLVKNCGGYRQRA